jgi:hypothetical protein
LQFYSENFRSSCESKNVSFQTNFAFNLYCLKFLLNCFSLNCRNSIQYSFVSRKDFCKFLANILISIAELHVVKKKIFDLCMNNYLSFKFIIFQKKFAGFRWVNSAFVLLFSLFLDFMWTKLFLLIRYLCYSREKRKAEGMLLLFKRQKEGWGRLWIVQQVWGRGVV